jgi:hypothetical protein
VLLHLKACERYATFWLAHNTTRVANCADIRFGGPLLSVIFPSTIPDQGQISTFSYLIFDIDKLINNIIQFQDNIFLISFCCDPQCEFTDIKMKAGKQFVGPVNVRKSDVHNVVSFNELIILSKAVKIQAPLQRFLEPNFSS